MLRIMSQLTGVVAGGTYYNTLYFGGETAGEADAASVAVVGFWTDLNQIMHSTLDWTVQTEAEFVNPSTGQITGIEAVPGGSGSGVATGDEAPPFTQGLLRWRTGVFAAGPSGRVTEIRGRVFLPGVSEAHNSVGVPSATYLSVANTAGTDLITAGAGAGGLVVYSPTRGQEALVSSRSAWNQWASLRSRRD